MLLEELLRNLREECIGEDILVRRVDIALVLEFLFELCKRRCLCILDGRQMLRWAIPPNAAPGNQSP